MANIRKNQLYIGTSIFFPELHNIEEEITNIDELRELQTYINNRNDLLKKAQGLAIMYKEKDEKETKSLIDKLWNKTPLEEVPIFIKCNDLFEPKDGWEDLYNYFDAEFKMQTWNLFGGDYFSNPVQSTVIKTLHMLENSNKLNHNIILKEKFLYKPPVNQPYDFAK